MFVTQAELRSAIYEYQIQQITEADDSIVLMAIQAATEEVKSYLMPNNKKEWNDGRIMYDVAAVFAAVGNNRNALLLAHTKTCAVWYIIQLSNVDMLYQHIKDRYDRAIDWLKKVNKGDITLTLPVLTPNPTDTTPAPFRADSRDKFNHE